jgi:hypothetical protein
MIQLLSGQRHIREFVFCGSSYCEKDLLIIRVFIRLTRGGRVKVGVIDR